MGGGHRPAKSGGGRAALPKMPLYAEPKKGFTIEEVSILKTLRLITEPKYADPRAVKVAVEMELDYDMRGYQDNIWGKLSGVSGNYVITTARVTDRRPPDVGGRQERLEWTSSSASFLRAWTCAAALWNVGIPNFAIADPSSGVEEVLAEGRVVVRAALTTYPLSSTRASVIFASLNAPVWEVMSMYMQVVLSISHAHVTARFAHNALVPNNVSLAPYAPLFSVNYRCESDVAYSLLCFGFVGVITNYHHGQVSYVGDDGNVVRLDPDLDGRAINYIPDPSADIYRFTAECLSLTKATLNSTPVTSPDYNIIYERQTIFRDLIAFYVDPKKELPDAIKPHRTASEYADHANQVLTKAGVHIMRPVTAGYGNYHLTDPPPENAHLPHRMAASTWHGLDLRCLVARSPPPRTLEACVAASETGYHVPIQEGLPAHRGFPCSYVAHVASERVSLNPTAATADDLATAAQEMPFFLCVGAQYGSLLRTEVGAAHYNARAAAVLRTPIHQARDGTLTTVATLTAW
jgi:hypothetical protein